MDIPKTQHQSIIRVTILYPMPLDSALDQELINFAKRCSGELEGSGSDGAERDLAFRFHSALGHVAFAEAVLQSFPQCIVKLRSLLPDLPGEE